MRYEIPAEIMENHKIPFSSKCLYSVILSLSHKFGYCFATNSFLSEKIGVDRRQVLNIINKLIEFDLIDVEFIMKKNSKEIEMRKITPTQLIAPPHEINCVPPTKLIAPPHEINCVPPTKLITPPHEINCVEVNLISNLNSVKQENKEIILNKFFSGSKYFGNYKLFEKDMKKGLKDEMKKLGKKIDFEFHWEKFHSKESSFQMEKENWQEWFLENFKKQIPEGNVKFIGPPTLEEMQSFAIEKGYSKTLGAKVHEYYSAGNWADSKGNSVKNWKQKMISVWFNDENKEKYKDKEEKTTKNNPYEHMTPDEIRQIQIENGSLGAPKYRRSMVADPQKGHINEIGDIFDNILNGLK